MPPSPDPLTNPYAPPAAEPRPSAEQDPSLSSYENERRSVLLLILLSIVTLGVYPIVWYLRRAPFLDSLDADRKVGALPWFALTSLVVLFGVAVAQAPQGVVRIAQLVSGITNLVLAFRVAHILRSDFARTGRIVGISGAGVFFFGCLYLQHVMNEAAGIPARSRRKAELAA